MAISQHQFYLDRKQSRVSVCCHSNCCSVHTDPSIHSLSFFFQAKLGSVRSLEEIAMDLTEHSGAKINRLGEACLKNNLITASNGSLVSTGVDFNYSCSVIFRFPTVNL